MDNKELIENNMQDENFKEIFSNIKEEILNAQYDIFKGANARILSMYYTIGKIIEENAKWGNKFVKNLSIRLKIDFPNKFKIYENILFGMSKRRKNERVVSKNSMVTQYSYFK